ncbi:EAL domain-containing protein [Hydrogenovibrio halophilus]|uniref:EAL domain-containing protein n=1 Tax=Hydrogenovibrio halophilus TaxID=373391 RepID=UPI0003A9B05A|nr:EAL domain-containing protein [Hydrogenovibrio halophilus]
MTGIAGQTRRFQCRLQGVIALFALWLLLWASVAQSDSQSLTLGVYADIPEEEALAQWQPLADYLDAQLPDHRIQLQALNEQGVHERIYTNQVDLLLVNPVLYEIVRAENTLTGAIATVQRQYDGMATSYLGGVIFSRADNTKAGFMPELAPLTDQRIAIAERESAGGFVIPLQEVLQKTGLNRNALSFQTLSHQDAVVEQVMAGQADLGFVRTGILERWLDQGRLQRQDLKIHTPRRLNSYPFLLSTTLYPEWPFLALSHIDEATIKQISVALLRLQADHPASQAAGINGFVPARDYISTENLLRDLRLPPYQQLPPFSWHVFWQTYRTEALIGLALLVLFTALFALNLGISHRLHRLGKDHRIQKERLHDIIRATNAGTWEWDLLTDAFSLNAQWADKMCHGQPLPGQHTLWLDWVHPEDRERVKAHLQAHLSGQREEYECELRLKDTNGDWRWFLDRGRAIEHQTNGEVRRMAGALSDITPLKRHAQLLERQNQRDKLLLNLPAMQARLNENAFLQYALDQMERLTDSRIGFVHKVDPDQKRIEMVAWSRQTETLCHAENETHYDVDQAGVWADSIRLKKPLINNAFHPPTQLSRLPAGHVTLKRILTVPVLDNGQVVLLIGLGNKHQEYASEDSDTVELIGNQVWRLMLQQRSQQALQRQQAQYGRLLNGIGQNFCALSLSPKTLAFSYLSDSVADIFGIGKTDLLDRRWDHVVSWDQADQRKAEQALTRLVQGLDSEKALQLSFTTPDGDHRTLRMLLHRVEAHDRTHSLDGLIENITYRLKSENDLKQAANVFRYAQEGIFITDTDGVILNVNQAFEKVTGYRRDEAIGQRPSLLKSGHHDRAFYQSMWQQLLDQGYWSGEVWNQRKNGEIYPEKLTLSAIHNQQGEPVEFIALFSDITVQKKQQQQLEYIAHFDSLTGLPNRSLLSDRLNQAMAFARRNHMSLAVAFIDLDGFKAINDLYGHQTGDQLLVSIADRFKLTLREEDTIARLGGDEFVAVMLDIKDKTEIYPLMERLLANANAAVTLSEVEVRVSASIGVSFYDPHSELDADQLVRQADQAMYQAKTQGKNQVFVFDHASSKTLARDSELLALEEALQNGDLCLHYQPKVNLRTGEILGYEALIRWQHPEKGLLGPGQFLTLLKDSPLSYQLGLWVIETALTQLDAWQKTGLYTAVSVNIEGDQLLEPDFAERLAELLAAYPEIDPSALTLEILETSALEDLYRVAEAMGTCQQLGVKFSIDDFGTGYASLTYLKALPTDELKVDKSFVQDLLIDPQSLAILESVVGMGRAFDLDVIAEGMEKDEEAVVLLSLGYEWAQGYHIARPMPASDVIDWKNHWMPSPHWQSIQPLEKNQLALLTAATEHRGWVKQLEDHLLERTPTPPPMAIDACQFGHWLTHHGFEHFHKTEMYQLLQQTHGQVHQLGQSLLELKQEGADRARIETGLNELQSLKQTLLKQLQALSDTTPLYLQ